MTVKYSLDLSLKLNPLINRSCKACGLYLNQLPVFEKTTNPQVFWVGLSAVQFNDDKKRLPLSPDTRTGTLIETIESPLSEKINFYKTNLVKCLPLNNGKIRYPSVQEMEKCYPNFVDELNILKPSIVFLLGKQVSSFIMKKENIVDYNLSKSFKYKISSSKDIFFVPIHHPSYILIYKRKKVNKYIRSIQLLVENYFNYQTRLYNVAS